MKQSTCPASVLAPSVQTAPVTQVPDMSGPMDISRNTPWPESYKCFNCSEQGHICPHCPKPRKQQIWSSTSAEVNLKSLVAKAVEAAKDAQEVSKRAEEAKENFQAGQW